jgi:predicted permease
MHSEFQFHLESRIADLMKNGLAREEAEERARRDFGSLELAKDECRDERAFEPVDRCVRYLRQALRSLSKSPGYCAAAILTLALGIGANTAIFTAIEGVVLKPLPYREPDRLVVALLYNRSLKHPTEVSYPDFLDWRRDARSFEQIAAFKPAGFDLTAPGLPQHLDGYEVSSNFFSTLGVTLLAGSSFSPDSDRIGGMPAAVISSRLWRERFEGSPAIIGRSIILNGIGFTITGVLPPSFYFENESADIYTPIGRADPLYQPDRTVHDIICIARLTSGIKIGQALAAMKALQEHIDELNPSTEKGESAYLVPLKQEIVGDVSDTLLLLFAAVSLVLLIACANVASLLLARSAARAREFAVRRALGATRMQIVRQLVTESVLLSVAGGLLGLAFAKVVLFAILTAFRGGLPRAGNIGINASVLLFAFGLSIAVGILFALLPAFKYGNTDVQAGLREGGRGSTASHQRTQSALVVAQIALALVLLSGAGLLFRSMMKLWAVNPGFTTQHILTFQVGLSPSVTETPDATRAAYDQLTRRIREIPGVEAAGMTALVPLGHNYNSGPFWIGPIRPSVSMAQIPRATYYPISPDYPGTMQIPLVLGRFLQRSDDIHSALVILVDNLMVSTYFHDRNPLGQTITIPHWGAQQNVLARIVGVVGHVEQYAMDGSAGSENPQIYFSLYQLPDDALPAFRQEINFVVRTPLSPAALTPSVENAVAAVGAAEPVYNIHTIRDIVSASLSRQRFPMILLVAFALSALLLATVGIYGLISYWTAQRSREIGVRMALGAAKWNVLQMLGGQGIRLALAGIALGTVAAVMLTRLLSSFSRLLYGVSATDWLTFVAVSLCLLLVALLASYLPARRAAALDPMAVLRQT